MSVKQKRDSQEQLVVSSRSFAKLIAGLGEQWDASFLSDLPRLRARMLKCNLGFSPWEMEHMYSTLVLHPAPLAMLARWTQEDGLWTIIPHQMQRVMLEASADTLGDPAQAGADQSAPNAASKARKRFTQLSLAPFTAEQLQSTAQTLKDAEWDASALAEFLRCCALLGAEGLPIALQTYNHVVQQQNGVAASANLVQLLMSCVAHEPEQARVDALMESLRASMRAAVPPLRFTPAHASALVARALGVSLAHAGPMFARKVQQYLVEDDVWEFLPREVRFGLKFPKQTAKGSIPRAGAALVRDLVDTDATAAEKSAASAPADEEGEWMPAPAAHLHQTLLDLAARSSAPDAATIEHAVRRFNAYVSWTLPALHTYLDLYARTPGAMPALATFRLLKDTLGVAVDSASFASLFVALSLDWSTEHLRRMQALRGQMRRAGLSFTDEDMQRLYNAGHARRALVARMEQWAQEDGARMPDQVVPVHRPPMTAVDARVLKRSPPRGSILPKQRAVASEDDARFVTEQLDSWWTAGDKGAPPAISAAADAAADKLPPSDASAANAAAAASAQEPPRVRRWLNDWIKG